MTKQVFPSLTELKHSIPRHCFESSVLMSMYYTVRALALSGGLMYLLSVVRQPEVLVWDLLVCGLYLWLQGTVFWGFFTIGHDCGHSSFSRYHSLNFVIGNLMHSLILTPFESWRISHRHHHKNTGNIDKDEIFYPHRKSDNQTQTRQLLYTGGSAWFAYLRFGFPSRKVNHFNPWTALFNRRVGAVIVSLCVYAAVLAVYAYLTFLLGWRTMGLYVFGPIFVFANYLVVVTFLHHNDEKTPWYGDSEWTYVKGNLSSVDRSYGALINNISHNIGTHQIHHLFPIIPHYKLVEATSHFRKAYPHLARQCDESILSAFFKTARMYVKYGVVEDNMQLFSLGDAVKSSKKAM